MKNVALIFPGQGSQCVGMGEGLYFLSDHAKVIFDKAEKIVNGLKEVMFKGPEGRLTETCFCQPAMFTVSVAALRAFQASEQYKLIKPVFTCGHSLGEYSALVACGALDFETGLKLVVRRAELMDKATQQAKGAMSAIIGADESLIGEICEKTGTQIANYNSPDQIVITGDASKVEEAGKLLSEAGARRVIPLPVSGAFHSSLMEEASKAFVDAVNDISFQKPQFSILSNVDAQPTDDIEAIKRCLPKQIVSSVLWTKSIQHIAEEGVMDFIELGEGSVLKGLLRKINQELNVQNIRKVDDIENLEFK